MGISVVCRVGLGIPRDCALHGGCGFRQGTARPVTAGILSSSERPDSGLRVELRRREPTGTRLGNDLPLQDGTGWMALFCQNMTEIAIELAASDSSYAEMATKFIDHFLWIAKAMNQMGPNGMWDEEDGFYYDILRYPDGSAARLKVRSMVGLLPLCATTVVEPWQRERIPRTIASNYERMQRMPELLKFMHPTGPGHFGVAERGIA